MAKRPARSEWRNVAKLRPSEGSKLGKGIRHEIKHLFHALYEKASFLRLVDPGFEEELKRLKLDRAMDVIGRAHRMERSERRVRNAIR
jgi:hypothetical protein